MSLPFPQFLKTFFKISGIVLLAFFSTGLVIIALFYGEEIKQLILREINKNLATEMTVQKIDFSLLRHFPNATVDLEKVIAKDAIDSKEKDTLLMADHLSLLFNLRSVFNKNISIKKIILQNGVVHVRIDKNGKNNYHFWKSSEGEKDTVNSVINLQKIILKNVLITYSNIHDNQQYTFTAKEGILSGKFSNDEFDLKTEVDLFVEHLYASGIDYVRNKNVKIKSILNVNNKTDLYRFGETQVRIADMLFDVNGDVRSTNTATALNLQVNSHKADLESLLSLLPPSYASYFGNIKSKGKFVFQSQIMGEAGHGHSPDVKFNFSLADGSLSPKGSASLKELSLQGMLTYTAKLKELNIQTFNGKLEGKEISGDLKLTDFQNPYLSLHAKAELDLNSVRHFITHDTLESLNGTMKMNIAFAGKVKDIKQYASRVNYNSKSSGNIALENVSFKIKKNPLEFKNINGQLSLDDNDVDVQSLNGNISSTDFHLKGTFKNFITFLLLPNQDAAIDATLSSSLIDLNELLANKATTTEDDTSYKIKINPRLICSLNVAAQKIIFRKFEATNIKGLVHISNQTISSQDLTFHSMKGDVAMRATIATGRKDGVQMDFNTKLNNINITELFYEMENFGQETMTDKNVKGLLTATIMFNSSWSKDLIINSDKVFSQADIKITNGELNDFKPILPLSKYLKLADLKHIKFSTLTNTITINDRKIFFPSMEINSSALNLTASGTHDFDNNVDYKLKMLLSDILGKKIKEQQNTEFGVIEDDGLGRSKLFLTMKGPVDNPKFSIDKKAIGDKIKNDLLADRKNIKQMLKQDLGMFKKDTTVQVKKKKKEEMQIDWGN